MELRRRRDNASAAAAEGSGEGAGTTKAESSEGDHPRQRHPLHSNGVPVQQPSSEDAADAVVGAAVRGGSLLMLLALIQVSCAQIPPATRIIGCPTAHAENENLNRMMREGKKNAE